MNDIRRACADPECPICMERDFTVPLYPPAEAPPEKGLDFLPVQLTRRHFEDADGVCLWCAPNGVGRAKDCPQ